MAEMPESLEVGYKTFHVERFGREEHEGYAGWTRFFKGRIGIADDHNSAEEEINSLLHECMHVIFRLDSLEGATEERVVTSMANGAVELLFRNPELTRWIAEEVEKRCGA